MFKEVNFENIIEYLDQVVFPVVITLPRYCDLKHRNLKLTAHRTTSSLFIIIRGLLADTTF